MSGAFYARAACTGKLAEVGPGSLRSEVERVMGAPLEVHGSLLYYGVVEFLFNGPDQMLCTAAIIHARQPVDESELPPAIHTERPEGWRRVRYAEFAHEVRALGHDVALERDDGGYRYYLISGTHNRVHVVSDSTQPDYDCLYSVELVTPAIGVATHVSDGVRWVVLNRPGTLNALTVADIADLTRIVRDPGPGVRALLFTGAGGRSFSAGVHTATFVDLDPAGARAFIELLRECVGAVRTATVPTAAMIDGYCLGGGFELALACDIRLATPGSRFGLPEVKVGVPSVIDAALLPALVGMTKAKEIILTGDLYDAAELDRLGLLNRVVDTERLQEETLALLARITRHTPTVLASQKRLFELWSNRPLAEAIAESVEEFAGVFAEPETIDQIRRYRATRPKMSTMD